MATIKTGLGCRACSTGDRIVHILAKEGSGFECETGAHKFVDNDQLMSSNPLRVALPKPVAKIQEGSVSFSITISSQLQDRLRQRFGDKLNASIGALLEVMLDGDAFVVSGVEQVTISKILGKEIRNSIDLSATAGQLAVERDEAKKEAEQWKKKGSGSILTDGDFRVKLDEKTSNAIKEKAQQNGLPVPEYLSSAVTIMISNGWL